MPSSGSNTHTAFPRLPNGDCDGYFEDMDVSIADAKNRLPALIRAVEGGEEVIITRNGKAVARVVPVAPKGQVHLGGMKGRMKLLPGWDDPVDLDRFLAGDL